jgi:hypothetical protein
VELDGLIFSRLSQHAFACVGRPVADRGGWQLFREPAAAGGRPKDVAVMQAPVACQRPMRRRRGRAAMLASMTLVLASCAAQAAAPGPAATAPAQAGQLRIIQAWVGTAVPIEGALSYIRLERATGATVTERQLPGSGQLTLRARPGAYRLVSWQRTCDGNCGNLDPPSQQCARHVTLRPGEQLTAAIRVNFASGCVIVLRR